MRHRGVLLVLFFLAIFSAGCVGTGEKSGSIRVDADSAYEDCFAMEPGNSMVYVFKSQKPLDFNIHFHEGGNIIYPVRKEGVTSDEGSCDAETTNYYCLMWTNPHSAPVWLGYSCEVK